MTEHYNQLKCLMLQNFYLSVCPLCNKIVAVTWISLSASFSAVIYGKQILDPSVRTFIVTSGYYGWGHQSIFYYQPRWSGFTSSPGDIYKFGPWPAISAFSQHLSITFSNFPSKGKSDIFEITFCKMYQLQKQIASKVPNYSTWNQLQ